MHQWLLVASAYQCTGLLTAVIGATDTNLLSLFIDDPDDIILLKVARNRGNPHQEKTRSPFTR